MGLGEGGAWTNPVGRKFSGHRPCTLAVCGQFSPSWGLLLSSYRHGGVLLSVPGFWHLGEWPLLPSLPGLGHEPKLRRLC